MNADACKWTNINWNEYIEKQMNLYDIIWMHIKNKLLVVRAELVSWIEMHEGEWKFIKNYIGDYLWMQINLDGSKWL